MTEYNSYEDLPLTPITTTPSDANKTGAWRTFRPIIDLDKCISCWICWKFCPDVSIKIVKDGDKGHPEVDYEHCKGCGICAHECPKEAIHMEKEV